MAGSLTDTVEKLILDHINGVAAWTPTGPLQVALITTTTPSTESTNGSEVVGGGYARQNLTMGAAAGTNPTTATNSVALNWSNMPACTVGGVEIWDSNGVPKRIYYATLAINKTFAAGDAFQIGIGQLTDQID